MSKPMTDETQREQSLRDLFYVVFRHKGKMVAWFLAVMAGVTAFTFLMPETYSSTAKLLLRLGRESVTLDPTATTGPVISVSQSRASEIQAELEILQSQELIERVVSALGPDEICERAAIKKMVFAWLGIKMPAANRSDAVQLIMDNLETSARSNIIRLSYNAGSPQSARKILSQLIELYLEMHIAVHQTYGAYEFFVQQSEELRHKLSQYEKDLQRLKDESGFSSLDEQLKLLLGQISAMEEEIGRTSAEMKSSKAKIQRLEKIVAGLPEQVVISETTGLPSTAAEAMRQEMFMLRLEESKIQKNYRDDSRMVESIHEQISDAQAMLDSEKDTHTQVTQGPNATHQQLQLALLNEQAALANHQSRLEAQQQQLAEAKGRLKTLNETEVTIRNLMREISVHETNYLRYTDNLEQARIEQAMEKQRIANINVVQQATLPVRPIRPKKSFNLMVGFFMATFGALTLAMLSQYLDHTIQTPEQLENCLQLRTLACIPRRRPGRAFAVSVCRGFSRILRKNSVGRPVPWDVPVYQREHYDTLGERLTSSLNGHGRVVPYALGVIGCRRGEGVSTITSNLVTVLSYQIKGRILLVDANSTSPTVHRLFCVHRAPGFTDIMANGQKRVVQRVANDRFDIVAAGKMNGKVPQAFESDGFRRFLNLVGIHYRLIVIDMPPLFETSHTARLAGLCDGVIMVVEAEHARREVARQAKQELLQWNANLVGVVLNKRRFYIPKWIYQKL
ncbi:MAG: GumC family protein [Planctomycetota bacterium]|jgi:uncharacterized protein involved in exopolysaccharide biosynthesis/Mrp family chromosome partitioning ATPase